MNILDQPRDSKMKKILLALLLFFISPAVYAATYYPAAGSGACNWSSPTCWSASQGGAGSAGTPTNADTVNMEGAVGTNVFDIVVDTTTVTAKTLVCINQAGATNHPTLTFTSGQSLTIAGSVTFVPQVVLSGTGTLAITSTATITTNGVTFPGDWRVATSTAQTMADNVSITGTLRNVSLGGTASSNTWAGAHNLSVGNLDLTTSPTGTTTWTFPASQTVTVTNGIHLNVTYGASYTIKSGTGSTSFLLNYSGTAANSYINGITFTDVNASGSAIVIYNWYGSTLTRVNNIQNVTTVNLITGAACGFFINCG